MYVWGPTKTDWTPVWSTRFQQLCEFKVQFGHCRVPVKYAANPKLGVWVSKQRRNYRFYQEGKSSPMTTECIRKLESVEFKWQQHNVAWDARLEQLREFTAHFGHCLVPDYYSANPQLVMWVSDQRRNYRLCQKGKPNPMTAERFFRIKPFLECWPSSRNAGAHYPASKEGGI